ncbi:hypothetical protein ACWERV_23260 [Streptomyces sp. NPDC004031]
MTTHVHRVARGLGASLTELALTSITAASAGLGGYIGFAAAPDSWATGRRAAVAGIAAVTFAVGLEDLLDDVVTPLRRLTSTHPTARYGTESVAPPATAYEGLARLRETACADSAHRAALDAYRIDHGRVLLTDGTRWQGYPDGTAVFYLAPGAYLRCWRDSKTDSATPSVVFTFITGRSDNPVGVTDIQQLQGLMADYTAHTADPAETGLTAG